MKFTYKDATYTFLGPSFYVHQWADHAGSIHYETRPAVMGADATGSIVILDAHEVKLLPDNLPESKPCHVYMEWGTPLGEKNATWYKPVPARFVSFFTDSDGEQYATVIFHNGEVNCVYAKSLTFNPNPPEVKPT